MIGLTPYDYARRKVTYCWLDERVTDAAKRLAEEGIGSMVVDDRDGKHVGMLTDTSIFNAVSSCTNLCNMLVGDLKLEPFVSAPMNSDMEDVMKKFDETRVERIALLDEEGEITAVLKRQNIERFARFEAGEKRYNERRLRTEDDNTATRR
jgi:predicted transcriptional regulator